MWMLTHGHPLLAFYPPQLDSVEAEAAPNRSLAFGINSAAQALAASKVRYLPDLYAS